MKRRTKNSNDLAIAIRGMSLKELGFILDSAADDLALNRELAALELARRG